MTLYNDLSEPLPILGKAYSMGQPSASPERYTENRAPLPTLGAQVTLIGAEDTKVNDLPVPSMGPVRRSGADKLVSEQGVSS